MEAKGMRRMTARGGLWAAALLLLGPGAVRATITEDAGRPRSSVEVVFVLDTTGSMGGLLEGAKQKVWSIANEIAKGKPAPDIKMGLIAYRDRGDQYVTKVVNLSRDLDKMYSELLSLKADGGGDGPEHVLQALDDAAAKITWEDDSRTFRVVYLVGDAPPHRDYGDTPDLEKLLQRLVRKGVVVNTVQCGSEGATTAEWRKIARLGEGRFLAIPQDGGVVAVATPFDERLAKLNAELESTMLGYGSRRNEAAEAKGMMARLSAVAPAAAAADRAAFKSSRGFGSELDLVEAVSGGKMDLAKAREAELPDSFKGLSAADRRAKLEGISRRREGLRKQIGELSQKRSDYIRKQAPAGPKDSFDAKLVDSLKAQAGRKGIAY